ncbi:MULTISPECIES: ABC transporter substrate-binding protein [unclassified Caballeronia]|uniref:ABC transporter substrate-binding protein n=1 Tax=unclassified Caballeronia TaxID=2646786 RepID=UPI002028CC67|nr:MULTISPECIES: ABC transporter substrate-binding protein [unclassified Caballeronia]
MSHQPCPRWATVTAAAFMLCAVSSALAQNSITVVSWGGGYTENQSKAFYQPFTKATNIVVKSQDYNGGLSEVRAQEQSGRVVWDALIGDLDQAKRGCEEGLLEKIDPAILPSAADGTPASKDFLPGTLTECGVGEATIGYVLAYNTQNGRAPASIKDFFDLKNFPGKRGLRKSPEVALEWALLADGVAPSEVYKQLSTPEGVNRAFNKLDTIKKNVVWWDAGAQPLQLLASKEVAMTSAYSGRIYVAQTQGSPFKISWNGQIWTTDVWMIPKGAPHMKDALEFVKFVSRPEQQAMLTSLASYGTVRKSAEALVKTPRGQKLDVLSATPTYGPNRAQGIQRDFDFWVDNEDSLTQRFNQWLLAD